MEPKLLLLDEPCTGLIREERENLARFLLRISHEIGPTIIWVEHDMQMVLGPGGPRRGARTTAPRSPRALPEEIRQAPEVIAAYLGQAPVAPIMPATDRPSPA